MRYKRKGKDAGRRPKIRAMRVDLPLELHRQFIGSSFYAMSNTAGEALRAMVRFAIDHEPKTADLPERQYVSIAKKP